MGGRSRIFLLPISWQIGVLLAITSLGWISEVSSLRTTPIIGKYTKERQESLRGQPAEVEVEEAVPEVAPPPPPVRDSLSSTYKVGIVAKSAASSIEGEEEGGNGTTKSPLTGIPQIDYLLDPNLPRELNGYNLTDYPFYVAVPEDIDFKCDGLHDGFYASVPHKCQVYHHCLFGTRYDFLCANYTAFDQKTFICHFVSEVDCDNSPKYYKRNEALYKEATTTSTSTTTTTTTTPAPTPAPQPSGQSSGGRVGPGGRRRRPSRRRRPQYEYYDDDDYEDDYTEEDEIEYTRPPPRRRKKKPAPPTRERPRNEDDDFAEEEEYPTRRRKQRPRTRPQSNRRPVDDAIEDDFEDNPPETSAPGVGLVPVGTSASRGKGVFDKPRAPPKIRPPVPLNEREKYNYGRQGASGSTSGSAPPAPAKPARDDYEDEVVERRTKPKRPTQPPPQSKGRDDYYEEEEEEEYERIPPPRGSFQNRRRKGQGSSRLKPTAEPEEEDDQYDYETREDTRGADRYPTGGGRDRRKKRPPAVAASVSVKRRRPGYRRDEEEYEYEDEEDTRVRPSNTRYKDTYSKGRNDDDYMERYPARQPPSRAITEAPARKRVQTPLRSSESQDRLRPLPSVYSNRKRIPAPVHEEVDEDLSEEELEEEPEEVRPPPKGRPRGGERVRVIKHRITPLSTTTKAPPPPPPTRAIPRTTTTPVPQHSRERDSFEEEEDDEGEYYESEEILEREPKTPVPPVARRPFRPSGSSNQNNGGTFAGSGRSVPSSSLQSFLPRGLQALGDRAQKKESITPIVVTGPTLKPKPTPVQVTIPTTTTTAPSPATTKTYRKEEVKYPERPQLVPNPPLQSYKPLTQYNGRQPTPKQEVQAPPPSPSFTRAPFVTNARPGYTTKSLPPALYSQKPQQNTLPPHSPVDSVPNNTDYEEDDFINDALHPTIPSSSSYPVTAAAAALSTRHGISLSQQQRTTLSTPTQLSYRFRNIPQSSPLVDYKAQQPSNPTFSNRGAPLHTSASHQTLSFIQPPQFVSFSAQQSDLNHRQVSDAYHGTNAWTGPTRIVVY